MPPFGISKWLVRLQWQVFWMTVSKFRPPSKNKNRSTRQNRLQRVINQTRYEGSDKTVCRELRQTNHYECFLQHAYARTCSREYVTCFANQNCVRGTSWEKNQKRLVPKIWFVIRKTRKYRTHRCTRLVNNQFWITANRLTTVYTTYP